MKVYAFTYCAKRFQKNVVLLRRPLLYVFLHVSKVPIHVFLQEPSMTAATPSKKGGKKGGKKGKDDTVTNGDASPEAGNGDMSLKRNSIPDPVGGTLLGTRN